MNNATIIEAAERYIRGEMGAEERTQFEQLRAANPEVDQLVVEHSLFLEHIKTFGDRQQFAATLQDIHTGLDENGSIAPAQPSGKAKLIYLWNRYKRTAAIAASIGGIAAIMISSILWSLTPKPASTAQVEKLSRDVVDTKIKTTELRADIEKIKNTTPVVPTIVYKTGGTGFLIESKGLMVTNAHVVSGSKNISVFNTKGEKFNAIVVRLDVKRDVAIIKIDDENFKPLPSLPYSIRKTASDIAESIFTLGFPREEIVYGEGYLSAKTGHDGDTLSCQIYIPANPGNSGGPIFNNNGEVIGILSEKETQTEGAVFAVQSKYIYRVVDELKKNSLYQNVKMPTKTTLAGLDKREQVKKIQDCVFMVKGD